MCYYFIFIKHEDYLIKHTIYLIFSLFYQMYHNIIYGATINKYYLVIVL